MSKENVGKYLNNVQPKTEHVFSKELEKNNKQPHNNFAAEIAVEAKQLEAQPKKVVAYKKKTCTGPPSLLVTELETIGYRVNYSLLTSLVLLQNHSRVLTMAAIQRKVRTSHRNSTEDWRVE